MFRVKRTGRGRWVTFDPAQDVLAETTLGLEADLHYALERGELTLRYQPIVDLANVRADGFEVLLRWEHPVHGMIPPLEFIPLAEATGMIEPIGRWVIEEACRQVAEWRRAYPGRDLFVSVNLSPVQVHDPTLVTHVKRALDAASLPPEMLMLEITESSLLQEDQGQSTLTELHRLGVRIAIDDFGTGYSALSYLQRFPIDVLKVHKSFVSTLGLGPKEGALARTVVAIARTLGVTAIAEGIEHPAQRNALRALGSRLGQGYHFAAPLLSDEATAWLEPKVA
jgi:EAL domain-containing protein (putative c-di-GMP-specific phosphodiesterase class I)